MINLACISKIEKEIKMKKIDLTDQKFGRLTVIRLVGKSKNGDKIWECKCDCGNIKNVTSSNLKGKTKSCGCLKRELEVKHKMTGTKLYNTWTHMKSRCFNSNDKHYKDYGGRGITVCDEWKDNFQSFFDWSMSNGYADNLTIDRKNNNGNYSPENCAWSTNKEQQRNKRNTCYLTYKEKTQSASEWAEEYGISVKTLTRRIRDGWSIEKALETPVKERKNKTNDSSR